MAFELPDLPYAYDALGTLHVCRNPGVSPRQTPSGLCRPTATSCLRVPALKASPSKNCGWQLREKRRPVNNVGQHYNHIHFWNWMTKDGGGSKVPGNLQKAMALILAVSTRCAKIS